MDISLPCQLAARHLFPRRLGRLSSESQAAESTLAVSGTRVVAPAEGLAFDGALCHALRFAAGRATRGLLSASHRGLAAKAFLRNRPARFPFPNGRSLSCPGSCSVPSNCCPRPLRGTVPLRESRFCRFPFRSCRSGCGSMSARGRSRWTVTLPVWRCPPWRWSRRPSAPRGSSASNPAGTRTPPVPEMTSKPSSRWGWPAGQSGSAEISAPERLGASVIHRTLDKLDKTKKGTGGSSFFEGTGVWVCELHGSARRERLGGTHRGEAKGVAERPVAHTVFTACQPCLSRPPSFGNPPPTSGRISQNEGDPPCREESPMKYASLVSVLLMPAVAWFCVADEKPAN